MKILLTGRNGQVGWELERVLPALGGIIATDRSSLDIFYPDLIRQAVRQAKPDIIVNAAAYTAVDRAESEPDLAMEINGVAPGVLGEEAKRLGVLLVHYSTDYIFDGNKSAPYVEDDTPNPLNVYGRTKHEAERRVAASGCRHLILRTSWVYSARGRNFALSILRAAREARELRVVNDQTGAPTSARAIAHATLRLLRSGTEGLYHMTCRGRTTWHGFAEEILRIAGLQNPVVAIGSDEYPAAARRPRNSLLDNGRLERASGIVLPDWRSEAQAVLAGAA